MRVTPHYNVIVIGGGIFGMVIAAKLYFSGNVNIAVIDAKFPGAGSKPAACLMKPSWFTTMGRDNYNPALETLSELYVLQVLQFKTGLIKHKVFWINPAEILQTTSFPIIIDEVEKIIDYNNKSRLIRVITKKIEYTATYVIVATGIWCNKILDQQIPGLTAKTGAAFLWKQNKIEHPFISPWAPFKQIVAFNRGDGLWAGDGTAILQKNWTNERLIKSSIRCSKAVGLSADNSVALIGNRPYAQGDDPCYLKRLGNLYVATGGGKNGTIAAGWAANEIYHDLCKERAFHKENKQ